MVCSFKNTKNTYGAINKAELFRDADVNRNKTSSMLMLVCTHALARKGK